MVYTFYDSSIVASKGALGSLTAILNKAEQLPNASTFPPARLYEDMRPLSSQFIHLAAQAIERMLARIDGREQVPMVDDIATFADMHQRIQEAQEALDKMDKDFVNRRAEISEPTILTPEWTANMTAAAFVTGSIPNIFFHLNMAYAILRKEGVALSKLDYIMPFMSPHIPKQ